MNVVNQPRWRALLKAVGDRLLDTVFGMDTARPVPLEQLEFDAHDGLQYWPSNWLNLLVLRRILGSLNISREDVFIDLGCGKGVVLFIAAHYPFGRIIGLDISGSMLRIARNNMARNMRRFACSDFEFVAANALDYAFPSDVTVCYYFNSFARPVLETVVANIEASVAAHPRAVTFVSLQGTMDEVLLGHGFRVVRRIRYLTVYKSEPSGD